MNSKETTQETIDEFNSFFRVFYSIDNGYFIASIIQQSLSRFLTEYGRIKCAGVAVSNTPGRTSAHNGRSTSNKQFPFNSICYLFMRAIIKITLFFHVQQRSAVYSGNDACKQSIRMQSAYLLL